RAKGVEVTDVVDHDWAKSIYFKDPNGIQLEFCCFTRNLNANDARMQDRFEMSVRRLGLEDPEALSAAKGVAEPNLDLLVGAPGKRSTSLERAGVVVFMMPAWMSPVWFLPISATVSGFRILVPLWLPPCSSACRNVR